MRSLEEVLAEDEQREIRQQTRVAWESRAKVPSHRLLVTAPKEPILRCRAIKQPEPPDWRSLRISSFQGYQTDKPDWYSGSKSRKHPESMDVTQWRHARGKEHTLYDWQLINYVDNIIEKLEIKPNPPGYCRPVQQVQKGRRQGELKLNLRHLDGAKIKLIARAEAKGKIELQKVRRHKKKDKGGRGSITWINPVGQACTQMKVGQAREMDIWKKQTYEWINVHCEQYGSIVRYDVLRDRVCPECGLMVGQRELFSLDSYSNLTGKNDPGDDDNAWKVKAAHNTSWYGPSSKPLKYDGRNRYQTKLWRAASETERRGYEYNIQDRDMDRLRELDPPLRKKACSLKADDRLNFIDLRLFTLIVEQDGKLMRSEVPYLWSSLYRESITDDVVKRSIERLIKSGRIETKVLKGRRIAIKLTEQYRKSIASDDITTCEIL